MAPRPQATVTFLMTDVEGSTRLLRELGEEYVEVLDTHRRLLESAVADNGGWLIDATADGIFAGFARAGDALRAAVGGQKKLAEHEWPGGRRLLVRMGVHTGEAIAVEDGYRGLAVHRTARICGAANGGQVLVSGATQALVEDAHESVALRPLGAYALKDFDRPVHLYQLQGDGLPLVSAAPRVARRRPRRLVAAAGAAAAAIAAVAIGVIATRGGAPSGSVAVRPNSVAVIDPAASAVVGSVPVGRRPIAVAASDDAVWVVNSDDETISEIDPKERAVERVKAAGGDPVNLAVARDAVWLLVSDTRGRRPGGYPVLLRRLDVPSNVIETVADVGTLFAGVFRDPLTLAADRDYVWVAVASRLVRAARREPLRDARAALSYVSGVAVGGGALWAIDSSTSTLYKLDLQTGAERARFALPGRPTAVAYGQGAVWVAVDAAGPVSSVVRIDPFSGTVAATIVGRGGKIAVGEGGVWIAGERSVARVDPRSNEVLRTIPLTHAPSAIAVGAGYIWVTVY